MEPPTSGARWGFQREPMARLAYATSQSAISPGPRCRDCSRRAADRPIATSPYRYRMGRPISNAR